MPRYPFANYLLSGFRRLESCGGQQTRIFIEMLRDRSTNLSLFLPLNNLKLNLLTKVKYQAGWRQCEVFVHSGFPGHVSTKILFKEIVTVLI